MTAMAAEALLDSDALLPKYFFVNEDHPENPVRICLISASGTFLAGLVRRNMTWSSIQLPLQLFDHPYIWSVHFLVDIHRRHSCFGRLDRRTSPVFLSNYENMTRSASTEKKRAESANSTITLPSLDNIDSGIIIEFISFVGCPLLKTDIYNAILRCLFWQGAVDKAATVGYLKCEDDVPVMIFIIYNLKCRSQQSLQGHHVIRLMYAVGKYYTERQVYQEFIFRMRFGRQIFASGCVTKAEASRRWCGGHGNTGAQNRRQWSIPCKIMTSTS